jgi:hypothetical protein
MKKFRHPPLQNLKKIGSQKWGALQAPQESVNKLYIGGDKSYVRSANIVAPPKSDNKIDYSKCL